MGARQPLPINGLTTFDRELLECSSDWTMCSGLQKQFMMDATRYVLRREIPGAIVECGVWRGGMMQIVARTLVAEADAPNMAYANQRELWLYDTYTGMPDPESPLDRDLYRGEHASHKMGREPRISDDGSPTIWCVADFDDVCTGMASTSYPKERIHFVKGLVEDTIPNEAPSEISILRVDTDWYSSTKHILHELFDRVSPSGVIILDDYDSWEGAKAATDEFLTERGLTPLLVRLDRGRVFTKS